MNMNSNTTNLTVVALGIVVALIGFYFGGIVWGNILLGFGAAHIVLGILDMFRPSVIRNPHEIESNPE